MSIACILLEGNLSLMIIQPYGCQCDICNSMVCSVPNTCNVLFYFLYFVYLYCKKYTLHD